MKSQNFSALALVLVVASAAEAQVQVPTQPPTAQTGQQPPNHKIQGPHGGDLLQIGTAQVETQLLPSGIRLFVYDNQGQPFDLSSARGLALLKLVGSAKRYRYDLFPEVQKDMSASSLAVAVDLSQVAGKEVELQIQLIGIPGAERRPAQFAADMVVPMTQLQATAAAIARQKVCPVSGQPLGSMGKPVSVEVQGRTVYVCCAGCIDAVKADPNKYLAMISSQQVVTDSTVVKATKEDSLFVAAQKFCPVMDEPLDAMGGPYKTVVQGHIVYLCCPGCAKKLHAKPAAYLAKLESQGVTPPEAKLPIR